MKFKIIFLFIFMFLFFFSQTVLYSDLSAEVKTTGDSSRRLLEGIIKKIEKRYAVSGFSAHFFQSSTIKAMEITDSASGKAFFKRPGKMRWEYEKPERQIIITDSRTLWIFRPEDNQVMIGEAPSFFEGGRGFSFLSDMKMIKQKFSINLEKKTEDGYYILNLLPREKAFDVSKIYLWISTKTSDVVRIVTYNSYGDETQIIFSNIQFKETLDDVMFSFNMPKGVDVLHLDQQ